MRRINAVLVGFVSLVPIGCATRQHSQFLDATLVRVQPEPGHGIEFGLSSFPAAPRPPFPLAVELLRMDRGHYSRMERIKYDVRLTNTSTAPVTVPWSAMVINRRDRPAIGYRHALFELILVDGTRPDFVADTFVLYGAPTVAGSLRILGAGETVVVRLTGIFSGSGFPDERNPVLYPPPGLRMKVGMMMYASDDEQFRVFQYQASVNTLPIKMIRGRQ